MDEIKKKYNNNENHQEGLVKEDLKEEMKDDIKPMQPLIKEPKKSASNGATVKYFKILSYIKFFCSFFSMIDEFNWLLWKMIKQN